VKVRYLALFMVMLMLVLGFTVGCGKDADDGSGDQGEAKGEFAPTGKVQGSVSMGTNATGTGYHAISSGIASVVSNHTDMKMIVRPTSGPTAWMPLLAEGKIDFGVPAKMESKWGFESNKEAGYPDTIPNLRLVCRGNKMDVTGLVVRKDSGIKSSKDLKGKRVGHGYGGAYTASLFSEAYLHSVGLTWDDVVPTPVSDTANALDMLQNGEVDAVYGLSVTTPKTAEVHNAVGLRLLNWGDWDPADFDNFPEDIKKSIEEMVPGYGVQLYEAGTGFIEEPVIGAYYDVTLVCNEALSEATVYHALKALYEHNDELGEIYAQLKLWTTDVMFDDAPLCPYHDGAIKFFKEKGLWNDKAEAKQKELLSLAETL
jgi:TRAP transporter TAXI family solute receptor